MDEKSWAGSVLKMDWSAVIYQSSAWEAFKQHCEFALGGIPKQKKRRGKKN